MLGQRHANVLRSHKDLEYMTAAWMVTLRQMSGATWSTQLQAAWEQLLDVLISSFKQGYLAGCQELSSKTLGSSTSTGPDVSSEEKAKQELSGLLPSVAAACEATTSTIPFHVTAIKTSAKVWRKVLKGGTAAKRLFFQVAFELSPEIHKIFEDVLLKKRGSVAHSVPSDLASDPFLQLHADRVFSAFSTLLNGHTPYAVIVPHLKVG